MASPSVQSFHEMKLQDAIRNSRDRVKQIDERGYRNMNPSFKGLVPNPSACGQRIMFVNPDQSWKVLEQTQPLTGGVVRSKQGLAVVKRLLDQRVEDVLNQQLVSESLPPMEQRIETLSGEDSLKLELSQALTILLTFEIGGLNEYKKVFNLINAIYKTINISLRLLPVLSKDEIEELIVIMEQVLRNFDNLIDLSADAGQATIANTYDGLLKLVSEFQDVLTDYLSKKQEGVSDKEVRLFIKANISKLQKVFKGISPIIRKIPGGSVVVNSTIDETRSILSSADSLPSSFSSSSDSTPSSDSVPSLEELSASRGLTDDEVQEVYDAIILAGTDDIESRKDGIRTLQQYASELTGRQVKARTAGRLYNIIKDYLTPEQNDMLLSQ